MLRPYTYTVHIYALYTHKNTTMKNYTIHTYIHTQTLTL